MFYSSTTSVDFDFGGAEERQFRTFKLYPNPTNDVINLQFDYSFAAEIIIYDILGKVQIKKPSVCIVENEPYTISFGHLFWSKYTIAIKDKQNNYYHIKRFEKLK